MTTTDPGDVRTEGPAPGSVLSRGVALVALVAIGAVLVWSRFVHLDQSLWIDETYSALYYIEIGPAEIIGGAYTINNHILFNLVAWAAGSAFGGTEVVYRLGAVLPSIAGVAWLCWWVRARFGMLAAAICGLLITASSEHLLLSRQARGYGFVYLAMTGTIVIGDRLIRSADSDDAAPKRSDLAWYGVVGFVGIGAFPIFAGPWALASAVLAVRARLRRGVVIAVTAAGLAALVLYTDAIGGLAKSADDFQHHRILPPSRWQAMFEWPRRFVGDTIAQLVGGSSVFAVRTATALFATALVGLGCRALARRDDRFTAIFLTVPIVATYLFAWLSGSAVHARYTAGFLLGAAVLFSVGCADLVHGVARRWRPPVSAAVAAVLASVLVMGIVVRVGVVSYRSVRIPQEDFRNPAADLRDFEATHGKVGLFVVTKSTYGVRYYFRAPDRTISLDDEPSRPSRVVTLSQLEDLACRGDDGLAVLTFDGDQADDALACVAEREGSVIVYEQWQRGGTTTLWLLPPSA